MNSVERVRNFLAQFPYNIQVIEFEESTKTAQDAARTVGVEVGQIAKTILFVTSGGPVLVTTSGDAKVRQSNLKKHLGVTGKVKLPDAAQTLELTGFPLGGVCPFALKSPLPILIDVSMQRFPVVYIAAGSSHAVAAVTVEQLLEITGGELCDLSRWSLKKAGIEVGSGTREPSDCV
ncbi:MAG TPA: aminoacyl-tRNA deacylase [Peptococcaceae bacterium]|nr:aminoacyl-tRNA deacylase [Peptococcaceae bacterium]